MCAGSLFILKEIQKWKYVCQRRIAHEREISKCSFGGHEVLKLLKQSCLMKIVSHVGPCYEKLVMELIVNLSLECNKEGTEEFRKMYI